MPILTQDIKLLKSAVMADTTDGGGQMTGVAVVDGQSNNLFPDTSAMDRAFGRVNMRKVFGVAHTTDTDTLLGAHAVITDAPDDPLVHCTLIKTSGWADERIAAKEAIEKYLVKGPKSQARIYDTHYAGGLQLRLFTFVGAAFPAGGDAVVLVNPNGASQYVRVLKTTLSTQNVAVVEGSATLVLPVSIAVCELGQALEMDVLGPPAQRVGISDAAYATLYTTTIASGAKFYGVKPLGVAGHAGDLSVTTAGGIYTPVVPAATIETPIIDQFPLVGRASIVATASTSIALPAIAGVAIGPNSVIRFPTAIEPKSLSITHGSNTLTDSAGVLYQGATAVGTVDYINGLATLNSDAGNYGSATLTPRYKPASVVGAASHSAYLTVTSANQGLAFTDIFSPAPALGSFTLSYMAQGRWYDLQDNMNGKLSGADSSYGVGTINYGTGSMAVTLGAIPDIGSPLLANWGDSSSAKAVTAGLPSKASLVISLSANTKVQGISITWSRGAVNYSATTDAAGVVSGDATGRLSYDTLTLEPAIFPDGNVTVTSKTIATTQNGISGSGGAYQLTGALPIVPGTFRATVLASWPSIVASGAPASFGLYDAAGVIYAEGVVAGTINYATGAVTILPTISKMCYWTSSTPGNLGAFNTGNAIFYRNYGAQPVTLQSPITNVSYSSGPETTFTTVITPSSWRLQIDTAYTNLITHGLMFTLGDTLYSAKSSVLAAGWNAATGAAAVAAAGSVSYTPASTETTISEGQVVSVTTIPASAAVTITSLPANGVNSVAWVNVANDASANTVAGGIFRTSNAPLKTGVFQVQSGTNNGSANDAGVLSGAFTGTVDYTRGIAIWAGPAIDPATLSYNAVFLQYLPLEASLLGIETARLPLDGKVPIYRSGDLVVVHNTLTYNLPNPLVKGTVYDLGRVRLASVRVKDAAGVVVPDTLYTAPLDPGTFMVPVGSDITAHPHPWKVEHRIEDMLLCSEADISGKLKFTRSLTHDFAAGSSFVSSAMPFGDLFARVYALFEQGTWTAVWQDTLIGATIIAQFNSAQYPLVVTNAGAIKERWLILFSNTTSFRVIGESVGEIGSGSTATVCAPINPATGVPYFSIPALGWGNGWAAGNCLRFNTDACGAPLWAVRTVLQGPASLESDQFTLAFRGDVDRA